MTRIIRRSQPKPQTVPLEEIVRDTIRTGAEPTLPDEESGSNRTDHVAIIKKYKSKVTNRASAIRAMCIECSGGSLSEVRDCAVTKCALYPYRMGDDPGNKKTKARMERDAALNRQPNEED